MSSPYRPARASPIDSGGFFVEHEDYDYAHIDWTITASGAPAAPPPPPAADIGRTDPADVLPRPDEDMQAWVARVGDGPYLYVALVRLAVSLAASAGGPAACRPAARAADIHSCYWCGARRPGTRRSPGPCAGCTR